VTYVGDGAGGLRVPLAFDRLGRFTPQVRHGATALGRAWLASAEEREGRREVDERRVGLTRRIGRHTVSIVYRRW